MYEPAFLEFDFLFSPIFFLTVSDKSPNFMEVAFNLLAVSQRLTKVLKIVK